MPNRGGSSDQLPGRGSRLSGGVPGGDRPALGRPRSVNSSFDGSSRRGVAGMDQGGYLSDRNDMGYQRAPRGVVNGDRAGHAYMNQRNVR